MEGNRGEIGSEGGELAAHADGDGFSGGDYFEFVFEGFDDRSARTGAA